MKRAAVVIFSLCLALGSFGCMGPTGPGMDSGSAGKLLTPSQRFTLKDLDGVPVRLDDVLSKHQAVLLDFWATWCGFCVEEMPDLIELQRKNQARGFTVLAVNAGESSRQAALFRDKMKLNFPIVLDEDMAVSQAYGLVGIPVSFLVNSEGKVLGEYHGFTKELTADVEKNLV